jgi:superfamily II DNA or RNA helicase
MVSEGVDIPRLRVGVYATTTATELFFRQAVGRFVRWTRGVPRQRAWLYIPDDPRLRTHAARVAEQRRHSLRRDGNAPFERETADDAPRADPDEQLSLFAVISAVATTDAGEPADDELFEEPDDLDDRLDLTLAPPPPLTGAAAAGDDGPLLTRREQKRQLREANARAARELARRAGLTHAQVNAELNRRSRVRRVSEATIDQLQRRLTAADGWLART